MFLRTLAVSSVIFGLMALFVAVTWHLPQGNAIPANPLYPALERAALALKPSQAQIHVWCQGQNQVQNHVQNTGCPRARDPRWATGPAAYLIVPHAIPATDCMLMAKALQEDAGFTDDGRLFARAGGGHNCDFRPYGLARYIYRDKPGGFEIKDDDTGSYRGPMAEYEASRRNQFVTQPAYSFLHMRARVDLGYDGKYGSHGMCVFNRYLGHWLLEGPCRMTWIARPPKKKVSSS